MDTPELPPSDQPPSPQSQPPESPTPDTSPPESPNFLTAQAPPPDPNAPLAPDDPLRYWYSTQQPPSQPMSTSRPFSEIWKVVWTQPDVMAYRDVLREADVSLNRSTKWIASTYGIALVLAFIILATVGVNNFNDFNTANNNSQFSQSTDTSVNTGSILCLGVICVPVVVAIALVLFFYSQLASRMSSHWFWEERGAMNKQRFCTQPSMPPLCSLAAWEISCHEFSCCNAFSTLYGSRFSYMSW